MQLELLKSKRCGTLGQYTQHFLSETRVYNSRGRLVMKGSALQSENSLVWFWHVTWSWPCTTEVQDGGQWIAWSSSKMSTVVSKSSPLAIWSFVWVVRDLGPCTFKTVSRRMCTVLVWCPVHSTSESALSFSLFEVRWLLQPVSLY